MSIDLSELIAVLKINFPLCQEDEYRILGMYTSGFQFVSAGVSKWFITPKGKLTRYTTQIPDAGLMVISDRSHPYDDLMEDLDAVEQDLLKATEPEDMDQALYLYAITPQGDGIRFVSFTRTDEPDEDLDEIQETWLE